LPVVVAVRGSVAAQAVGVAGVVKMNFWPAAGIVTQGTLPGIVGVGGCMAGLAVGHFQVIRVDVVPVVCGVAGGATAVVMCARCSVAGGAVI